MTKPDVDKALEAIEEAHDDEVARKIEMQFVTQTENQATEDAIFGDADGKPVTQ